MAKILSASQTPTITASSAYSSGQALGGLMTFTGLVNSGSAMLLGISIFDKANQKSSIDLLFFNQTFTATADKTTIAVSAADLVNMHGWKNVAAADYATVQSGRAVATTIFITPMPLVAALDNNLYVQMVCRGTPTYGATSDLVVKLIVSDCMPNLP